MRQVKEGEMMDLSAYRRQIQRALQTESLHIIKRELKALLDIAARPTKSGDWLNAGALHHALLDEVVRGYDDMVQRIDEDGDIAILVDEIAQGLSECLEQSNADSETRRAWLEALFEAVLTDIELGGIDLMPSAYEAIVEQANDEEWVWIEQRVQMAMLKSDDWAREELERLLVEGQKRHELANGKTPH